MEPGNKIVDGRYTIQRKLGQGAFGAVYQALDTVSDTPVAIKIVPSEVSREAHELSDLKQNFKLIHKLSHSHIATMRTLEYDKALDKYCLVMEYVEGKNLSVYRKNQPDRKVPLRDAIKICRQLAEAIDYAHEESILHRDVKPENVLIEATGKVKLLDFGLASQIRSTVMKLSRTVDANAMAGTRPYMSPEQFKSKPPGPASDIWALGIVFYEMITGELPFYSDDVQVLMHGVCTIEPDPIPQLNKTQNQIIQKVLAKTPKARFAKAVDFAKALEDSIKPKGSKKKWIALGVLALLLPILIYLRTTYWEVVSEEKEKQAILEQKQLNKEYFESLTPIEKVAQDLFDKMLEKKSAMYRNGIGLLPSFPGCKELVYSRATTALIRSANEKEWDILVRKDLQAIADDQGMVLSYRKEKNTDDGLTEVLQSQAVVVGNCVGDDLHMRVIDTNSVALAAAWGSWKDDSAERKRAEQQLAEAKRKQTEAKAKQEQEAQALAEQKTMEQQRQALQAKEAVEKERLREEVRLAEAKRQEEVVKRKQAEIKMTEMQQALADAKKAAESKALAQQRENARARRTEAERRKREEADAAQAAERQREREETAKNAQYSLTIKTTPEDASIRILNIGPRYEDGIELKPGKYHIEVSKSGYKRHREWIKLASREMVHLVDLEKVAEPSPSYMPKTQRQETQPTYSNSFSSSSSSHSAGDTWTDTVTGMEFKWVPKGCFQMGGAGEYDGKPIHRVCLSQGYWLGKYEITQEQWEKVMGSNPSSFDGCGKRCPVERVSWDDVQTFVKKLSHKSNATFGLPTEAQWEYACRSGGKKEDYCGSNDIDRVAWYDENSNNKTHQVGQKDGNGLGLYDMSGNVWEWVQDRYGAYSSGSTTDPKGPDSASYRVDRGGSWNYDADFARSAFRHGYVPGNRSYDLGARLVRQP